MGALGGKVVALDRGFRPSRLRRQPTAELGTEPVQPPAELIAVSLRDVLDRQVGQPAPGQTLQQVPGGALREVPRPKKLDDRPLEGAAPWRRLRVGERRIIFRPLTQQEKVLYGAEVGYIVDRIIDRRDLERAVKTLR